jgi:hypothetical protein
MDWNMGIKHVIEGYRDMGEMFGLYKNLDDECREIGLIRWEKDIGLDKLREKLIFLDFNGADFQLYRLGSVGYCLMHPYKFAKQLGKGKRIFIERRID